MESWFERASPKVTDTKPVESKERKYVHDFDAISSPDDFLDAVDFKVLNEIFDEIAARSVNESETPENRSQYQVDPNRIYFPSQLTNNRNRSINGMANVSIGEIELKWDFPPGEILPIAEALNSLKTLMHESAHIRGGYGHSESPFEFTDDKIFSTETFKIGLEERYYTREVFGDAELAGIAGMPLSEAITEEIGQQVFREYLVRTGNSTYLKSQEVEDIIGYGSYFYERFALSFVLQLLSERLELPVAELWKGLTNAYINGNEDVLRIMTEISDLLENDPALVQILKTVFEEGDAERVYFDLLHQTAPLPELPPVLNIFKYLRVSKERAEALQKRGAAVDALKFEANALGNALGLRK